LRSSTTHNVKSSARFQRCGQGRTLAALLLGFVFLKPALLQAQCSKVVSTPRAAADCAAHVTPVDTVATIDPARAYTLAELVDIAEQNNPHTRVVWEQAKQKAEELGVARSAYYPVLAGVAAFADERLIEPFPKPLAPRGYTMVEVPAVVPEVTLDYLLFDFGKRQAGVDAATAEKLRAGANLIQANQQVAFLVASGYYQLLAQQERLEAARQTLKTAQTTQDAAEAQLANGRSTLPDALNARAETAQAAFDMESADGDEKIARVRLTESLGVEPSPDITIDGAKNAPIPDALVIPIDTLISRAMADRPDLMAKAQDIRAADDAIRSAKSEYMPKVVLSANAAQTSVWPTTDYGQLGNASEPTWAAQLAVEWRLFDGGARKHELAEARSKKRAAQDELRESRDETTRQVWTAYIGFRTALRKQQAALALLDAANSSYSASLEAYKYGVKNLIDVVTAEKQLALARYSSVSARSELFLQAVNLEFSTGNLLRPQPPATTTSAPRVQEGPTQ